MKNVHCCGREEDPHVKEQITYQRSFKLLRDYTIEKALKAYFEKQQERFYCDQCESNMGSIKRTIISLPKTLILDFRYFEPIRFQISNKNF